MNLFSLSSTSFVQGFVIEYDEKLNSTFCLSMCRVYVFFR